MYLTYVKYMHGATLVLVVKNAPGHKKNPEVQISYNLEARKFAK